MQSLPKDKKPDMGLVEFVSLMALMTSLVALSIDAMLPALHQIGEDLAIVNAQHTHLIVSLFFIGMALGQFYYGPIADDKGRRYTIVSGLVVFALGTLVCMFTDSLLVMLIGRIIQAFGASGPRIAALALIRDKYEGDAMARVMSFIMMVFVLVPMLAPSFGQAILFWLSWRAIYASFLVIALIAGLWFYIRQPETLTEDNRTPFSWVQLGASCKYILSHKVVMFYTLSIGFIFGSFLAYISSSQTLFQQIYDTGELFPLYFALLAFSIGLASFVNGKLVMRLGMHKLCYWAMFGWIGFALLLTLLSSTSNGIPQLWQFVSILFCAFFCIGILFGNINALAMTPLGNMAGFGAAVIGSVSNAAAVTTAVFVGSFIENSITPIAIGFVFFGIISLMFFRLAATNKTSYPEFKLLKRH
jgi:DHA1 family bicyclomycin/chloramphenicol resistance-like MFS transporter